MDRGSIALTGIYAQTSRNNIIAFRKDGKFMVSRIDDKVFMGKNILHVDVWKKGDDRTTYNMIYLDAKSGRAMAKRFNVKAITRDKEYDLTTGADGCKTLYFEAHPNGEAEVIKVYLRPRPRLKNPVFEYDFADLAIKGRGTLGNILTKFAVQKIVMKERGVSTLGGRKIWFDEDVMRLNVDARGVFIGEFSGEDEILVP